MVICSFHWHCDNWHTAFWSELCASRNIASASVCRFWPQIRVCRQMLSRIHCQSASLQLAFWPILHRGPAAAPCVQSIWVWLGYWSTINGCSCGAWSWGVTGISASICTTASAHCAKWVSLPSVKIELMFRISPHPQIFGGKPPRQSADHKISCGSVSAAGHIHHPHISDSGAVLWKCGNPDGKKQAVIKPAQDKSVLAVISGAANVQVITCRD